MIRSPASSTPPSPNINCAETDSSSSQTTQLSQHLVSVDNIAKELNLGIESNPPNHSKKSQKGDDRDDYKKTNPSSNRTSSNTQLTLNDLRTSSSIHKVPHDEAKKLLHALREDIINNWNQKKIRGNDQDYINDEQENLITRIDNTRAVIGQMNISLQKKVDIDFYVAFQAGYSAGLMALKNENNRASVSIEYMFTLPGSCGLGRMFIEQAVEASMSLGGHGNVHVEAKPEATGFYKSLGFTQDPSDPIETAMVLHSKSRENLNVDTQEGVRSANSVSRGARSRLPNPASQNAQIKVELIEVKNPKHQSPASPDKIFSLSKDNSGNYGFLSAQGTQMTSTDTPPANGQFVYIIHPEDPDCIRVGAQMLFTTEDRQRFVIDGHTAISHRDPVLYAGTLILQDGQLLYWTNHSGHYEPGEEARFTNLSAKAKELLPESLFKNYKELPDEEKRELLALGGYADLEFSSSSEDEETTTLKIDSDNTDNQSLIVASSSSRPNIAGSLLSKAGDVEHSTKVRSALDSYYASQFKVDGEFSTTIQKIEKLDQQVRVDPPKWFSTLENGDIFKRKTWNHYARLLLAISPNNPNELIRAAAPAVVAPFDFAIRATLQALKEGKLSSKEAIELIYKPDADYASPASVVAPYRALPQVKKLADQLFVDVPVQILNGAQPSEKETIQDFFVQTLNERQPGAPSLARQLYEAPFYGSPKESDNLKLKMEQEIGLHLSKPLFKALKAEIKKTAGSSTTKTSSITTQNESLSSEPVAFTSSFNQSAQDIVSKFREFSDKQHRISAAMKEADIDHQKKELEQKLKKWQDKLHTHELSEYSNNVTEAYNKSRAANVQAEARSNWDVINASNIDHQHQRSEQHRKASIETSNLSFAIASSKAYQEATTYNLRKTFEIEQIRRSMQTSSPCTDNNTGELPNDTALDTNSLRSAGSSWSLQSNMNSGSAESLGTYPNYSIPELPPAHTGSTQSIRPDDSYEQEKEYRNFRMNKLQEEKQQIETQGKEVAQYRKEIDQAQQAKEERIAKGQNAKLKVMGLDDYRSMNPL